MIYNDIYIYILMHVRFHLSILLSFFIPLSIFLSFFPNLPHPSLSPSHAHSFNTCSWLVLAGATVVAVGGACSCLELASGAQSACRSFRGSRSNCAIFASCTQGAGAGGGCNGANNSRVFASLTFDAD